jgi:hypothetical protein
LTVRCSRRLSTKPHQQAGQVVGNLGLRFAEQLDELADGALAAAERLQYPHPGDLAEAAKVLRHDVRLKRPLGQPKR